MSIRDEEERLFQELRERDPHIVTDGLVQEEAYLQARFKIVYILKEVNGGEAWDLREFLRRGGRAQTWDNIARWTEAILTLETSHDWDYWEQNNELRRKTYLPKIGAVNLKKTSGGHTADKRSIAAAAIENEQLLCKQLALYAPDLIICCGTEGAFIRTYFRDGPPPWQRTRRGVFYMETNGQLLVSFAHPEARTKDCFLHYALVDAMTEIIRRKKR